MLHKEKTPTVKHYVIFHNRLSTVSGCYATVAKRLPNKRLSPALCVLANKTRFPEHIFANTNEVMRKSYNVYPDYYSTSNIK